MKRLSFLLLALLPIAVFSATWTAPTAYPVKIVTDSIKSVYPTDSLTGTDSNTVFKDMRIDPTAIYAIQFRDSIGGSDSMHLSLRVYNTAGTLIYAGYVDTTVGGTTYKVVALPINKTVFGNTFTCKMIGIVAASRKKIRTAALLRAIPITPYNPAVTRP